MQSHIHKRRQREKTIQRSVLPTDCKTHTCAGVGLYVWFIHGTRTGYRGWFTESNLLIVGGCAGFLLMFSYTGCVGFVGFTQDHGGKKYGTINFASSGRLTGSNSIIFATPSWPIILIAWSIPPDSVPTYFSHLAVNVATSCRWQPYVSTTCIIQVLQLKTYWRHTIGCECCHPLQASSHMKT